MLKKHQIDKIITEYAATGKLRQTARRCEVSIEAVQKYTKLYTNNTIINDCPPGNPINKDINTNINTIDNNINIENIDINIDKDENIESISKNINIPLNVKYIEKLSKILDLAIKRYGKEYKNVHPNYISKDIGIFTDKLLRLQGENTGGSDIKQIIFNNFGSNKDMLELIQSIQNSKHKIIDIPQ